MKSPETEYVDLTAGATCPGEQPLQKCAKPRHLLEKIVRAAAGQSDLELDEPSENGWSSHDYLVAYCHVCKVDCGVRVAMSEDGRPGERVQASFTTAF